MDALASPAVSPAAARLRDRIANATEAARVRTMPPPGYTEHPLEQGSIKVGGCELRLRRSPAAVMSISCGSERLAGSAGGELLAYHYQSLNDSDFTLFRQQYATTNTRAYGKTNISNDTCAAGRCAESRDWQTTVTKAFLAADKASLLLQIDVSADAVTFYGACKHVWLLLTPSREGERVRLSVDLQTEAKTSTRIPEFQRLTFSPAGINGVAVDKLGTQVDALDVVEAGGAHLHGVGEGGVTLTLGGKQATAVSLDTSLVSVARPTAFPTPLQPLTEAELAAGVHFILHDNLWDTVSAPQSRLCALAAALTKSLLLRITRSGTRGRTVWLRATGCAAAMTASASRCSSRM